MLTVAEFRTLQARIRENPLPFMASGLTIRTKQHEGQAPTTTLDVNRPQLKVHEGLWDMRRAGKPPRVIVLKARQPGISTYCSGLNVTTKLTQPFTITMTIAHVEDGATNLFQREKFMVSRLPLGLRPKMKGDKKNQINFDHVQCRDGRVELSSEGMIGYATGKPIWRGLTIHGCHLSEFAFFVRDKEVLLGILQAVPQSPDSYIVIESTANGMGNAFQVEWQRAEAGESGFRTVFIPWYELPDAVMPVPKDFVMESDELQIAKEHKIGLPQMVWRRHVLETQCQGQQDLFDQEYPTTVSSAFLVTGRPAFPVAVLRRMREKAAEATVHTGRLDMTHTDPRKQFVPHEEGELHIWKWPTAEHAYIIGCDPSAGVEGGDFSSCSVFDRHTTEIVATWHGLLSPIELAHVLMDLGMFYHEAVLAVEITGGHGFSTMEECRARGYRNFYIWQRLDRIKNTMTNYYGWMTTFATRPLLFDGMHFALSHGEIMIWDPETCFELMGCRYISNERAEGEDHDDRAFSAMISWRVHLETPMPDTGQLPRLAYMHGLDKAPVVERDDSHLSNVDRQVWDAVDQERQGSGRQPLGTPAAFIATDDELQAPNEELDPYQSEPPGGWW